MTPRDDLDPRVVAQLRAALDDDSDGAARVDVEQLWADVAAEVPARRRRHAARRAVLVGAAGVLVVGAAVTGAIGADGLGSRAPASGGGSATPAQADASAPLVTADLLPAQERSPRTTATGPVAWVLPASCGVGLSAPATADMVTARDGAGSFGAEVDLAQVAAFDDDDAAAAELQRVRDALAGCAADDPAVTIAALTGDGVVADVDGGTSAAVLQVGDAVVLVSADGPEGTLGDVRQRVVDRAGAVAQRAGPGS